MGLMDKRLGTLESVFITYFSGGVLIGLIMLIQRGGNYPRALRRRGMLIPPAPWGLSSSELVLQRPRLGLVAAFTIFVSAQFTMGALVDHFGWMGSAVRL